MAHRGIHNHSGRLMKKAGAPALNNHQTLWLWVPAHGGDDDEKFIPSA
jgi:hypothetical protein